jgi:hypothetical protein
LQRWGSQLWHHQDGHIHMPPHVQEARDLPDSALILEGEAVLEVGSGAHAHRRASTHLRAQPRAWRDERGRRERERKHHLCEREAEQTGELSVKGATPADDFSFVISSK